MSAHPTAGACPFLDPERLFHDLAAARGEKGLPFSDVFDARMVTRYDDIVHALHDPATFSSTPVVPEMPSPWREQFDGRVPSRGTLIGLDNPDHDRLRTSVNTFFVPRRLARFEPWITERAHRLIDGFVERGEADLKTAFALPLPLAVIAHIVGLDVDRSDWIGAGLGFFLGPRDLHHDGTPEEKAARLLELHDYILEVMAQRKLDRRDDLISHVWNERDAGLEMTDFEMLSMFPGLMLAGHETSSNLICTALLHLLPDRDRWEHAQRDDASRAEALEEMFRFESAITGMKRLVTRDTVLGGVPLKAGEQVFLAYASGSRDAARFGHPDEVDLERTWAVPHLGFGQGVHACLGAPLARLLLRVELGVLHHRLPGLRLAVPPAEVEHTVVSEGRGVVALPLAWTPQAQPVAVREHPAPLAANGDPLPVVVTGRRALTEDVVELVLTADDGVVLPAWEPGAHIDLELPDGALRQYSLCGRPSDRELRIAVLREPTGRGGSRQVHDAVRLGERLRIRGPRNHFRLRPASFALFVAGGIGITPLLPMIEEMERRNTDWRLLFLGRERRRMPYVRELLEQYGHRVYAWPSAERGRYDLDDVWRRMPPGDTAVYACGPEQLLSGLEESARRHGTENRLVVERFAPHRVDHAPNRPIEIELARSGRTVMVDANESVLDGLNRGGANILSTCREGTCGTCEVRVLEGVPEHRDSVLSLEERLANDSIMTCVSRCRGNRLVLDV